MSDELQNIEDQQAEQKPRKPDYEIHTVTEEDGKTMWQKEGALWSNDAGYLTGNYGGQKIVLQSREAKDAVMRMRQEKQEAPVNLSQSQSQSM